VIGGLEPTGQRAAKWERRKAVDDGSRYPRFIGIGMSIADRPFQATGRTGQVSGDSSGRGRHR